MRLWHRPRTGTRPTRPGGNLWQPQKHSQLHLGRRDSRPTKLLVTGASGLLGNRLTELASRKGYEVFSAYKEHPPTHGKHVRLDITNEAEVRKTVSEIRPQAIVNAAALTDVDRCEADPDLAHLVNSRAVGHLAEAAKDPEAFFVQVSTDYVFDGEKGNYSETDVPRPINSYGLSKLEGERATKALGESGWCVARASVVYGWGRSHRPNAATYVYEKLSKGEPISMVKGQYSSPTLNTNLATMILEIVERRVSGIIHTAGASRLSRYDFALGLAETLGLNTQLISAVGAQQMRWKARRPRDSSLNVGRASRALTQKPLEIRRAYEIFKEESLTAKPSQPS